MSEVAKTIERVLEEELRFAGFNIETGSLINNRYIGASIRLDKLAEEIAEKIERK